jgi:hypothetical protein
VSGQRHACVQVVRAGGGVRLALATLDGGGLSWLLERELGVKAGDRVLLIPFGQPHVIRFSTTGFDVQHPVECRDDMLACPVHELASMLDGPPVEGLGRYEAEVDDDGELRIGDRIGGP